MSGGTGVFKQQDTDDALEGLVLVALHRAGITAEITTCEKLAEREYLLT